MGHWDWKWFFVVMMLVGGYMYYDLSGKSDLTKTLLARGMTSPGTVIDKRERPHRRGTDYYVKFNYKVEGQETQKAELEVPSSYYDSVGKGTTIEVLYLKEDPKQCMIKGLKLASEGVVTFALVALILGSAGSGWVAVDYAKSAKG